MKRILTAVRPATLLRALVPHTPLLPPHQPRFASSPTSVAPRRAGDPSIQQASERQPSWGDGAMAWRCGTPRLDVQRLRWARSMGVGAGSSVDASSRVHPSAEIGPGAVILGGVEVGEGCSIGPCCVIGPDVQMGARYCSPEFLAGLFFSPHFHCSTGASRVAKLAPGVMYRGTSLIRKRPSLRPYRSPMPRAIRRP